ncbi:Uncharacterised protein [Mycobacteroides abscessus subsp. abscessus]|nr:Uncharacterised protein [Mycobacteroides abscessus subsp. abscessus]
MDIGRMKMTSLLNSTRCSARKATSSKKEPSAYGFGESCCCATVVGVVVASAHTTSVSSTTCMPAAVKSATRCRRMLIARR